ncbi:hypothetical protein [Agromyces larvae]|uniref:Uncharacterized protein n=1 Tax=Agromyces larvae TaxID=2929802 RepID=A0ABY4C212_9MICO|nr:hypothetical protein [Agromyces larvae]UOE45518.1 hypothetical protein MTO99_07100 [Agromyces larvae]
MTIASPTPTTARIHRCHQFPEKIQHRSLEAAFAEVDRVKQQRDVQLHVYACESCGYFHCSKSSGTAGDVRGNVRVGRRVHRADIPLWTVGTDGRPTETVRDERYVETTDKRSGSRQASIEAIESALRAHSSPTSVKASELAGWTGLSDYRTTEALKAMGWVPTGASKSRLWHRPGVERAARAPLPVAEPESVPADPWQIVDLNAVRDLSVDQLLRTYKTAGKYLEVRIRDR